jgi:hypothetical protein
LDFFAIAKSDSYISLSHNVARTVIGSLGSLGCKKHENFNPKMFTANFSPSDGKFESLESYFYFIMCKRNITGKRSPEHLRSPTVEPRLRGKFMGEEMPFTRGPMAI